MQIAFVVEIGHPRRELVGANWPRLARLALCRRSDQLIVSHLGLALRLAVDRPRGPVVMRRGVLGAFIAMREHAEAELRIFIEHLALWGRVVEGRGEEAGVAQQLLKAHADLAAPGGPR